MDVLTTAPSDGSAVGEIMVPEWANMSYDAQYDDIFSKPLNLKKVTPKPDPKAQAKVDAGARADGWEGGRPGLLTGSEPRAMLTAAGACMQWCALLCKPAHCRCQPASPPCVLRATCACAAGPRRQAHPLL